MVEGRPKYVTALAETDTAGGWRVHKARGGVLMDIETNELLLRRLSMPHSPRWYQHQMWILESGEGSLAKVDLHQCTWQTIAQVPGFTRGLDFYGPLAFIGLSQVRESATFSGIPLVHRLNERTCGVWVMQIETRQTTGSCALKRACKRFLRCRCCQGHGFRRCWSGAMSGWRSRMCCPMRRLLKCSFLPQPNASSPPRCIVSRAWSSLA